MRERAFHKHVGLERVLFRIGISRDSTDAVPQVVELVKRIGGLDWMGFKIFAVHVQITHLIFPLINILRVLFAELLNMSRHRGYISVV